MDGLGTSARKSHAPAGQCPCGLSAPKTGALPQRATELKLSTGRYRKMTADKGRGLPEEDRGTIEGFIEDLPDISASREYKYMAYLRNVRVGMLQKPFVDTTKVDIKRISKAIKELKVVRGNGTVEKPAEASQFSSDGGFLKDPNTNPAKPGKNVARPKPIPPTTSSNEKSNRSGIDALLGPVQVPPAIKIGPRNAPNSPPTTPPRKRPMEAR